MIGETQTQPDQPDKPDSGKLAPHEKATPAEDVRQSRSYEYRLSTDATFRRYRLRRECGPITDRELHRDCVSSFTRDYPRR
jgi:hypothetical protein